MAFRKVFLVFHLSIIGTYVLVHHVHGRLGTRYTYGRTADIDCDTDIPVYGLSLLNLLTDQPRSCNCKMRFSRRTSVYTKSNYIYNEDAKMYGDTSSLIATVVEANNEMAVTVGENETRFNSTSEEYFTSDPFTFDFVCKGGSFDQVYVPHSENEFTFDHRNGPDAPPYSLRCHPDHIFHIYGLIKLILTRRFRESCTCFLRFSKKSGLKTHRHILFENIQTNDEDTEIFKMEFDASSANWNINGSGENISISLEEQYNITSASSLEDCLLFDFACNSDDFDEFIPKDCIEESEATESSENDSSDVSDGYSENDDGSDGNGGDNENDRNNENNGNYVNNENDGNDENDVNDGDNGIGGNQNTEKQGASDENNKISTGLLIAIIIAVCVVLTLILLLVIYIMAYLRKKNDVPIVTNAERETPVTEAKEDDTETKQTEVTVQSSVETASGGSGSTANQSSRASSQASSSVSEATYSLDDAGSMI